MYSAINVGPLMQSAQFFLRGKIMESRNERSKSSTEFSTMKVMEINIRRTEGNS